MKNTIFYFLMLTGLAAFSQEDLWAVAEIVSPEVNPDHSVTFRFMAPNAEEVKLSGDWLPSEGWIPGSIAMKKEEGGLWTYTTEPISPELYNYSFLVDGLNVTDPNNVYLIRDVANVTNVFIVGGEQADLYKVNAVPHGTVSRRWYNSPKNEKMRRMTIYMPPGYEAAKEKFPVLYLLHGMGGDEEAWIALGRTAQVLDNLIAQGKVKPMVVVMPNGNVAQEAAPGESSLGLYKPTFQLPNTMDGKYEATFQDIIKFVESNYRVSTKKSDRAIAGLSMGGFHSLHISRIYPKTFDYIGLFSAAILPDQNVTSAVYKNLDETLRAQKDNGYKLYWIAMGKTDFLHQSGVEYRKTLDKIGMKYTYVESEGGHTWRNWRVYLTKFTPLLFR